MKSSVSAADLSCPYCRGLHIQLRFAGGVLCTTTFVIRCIACDPCEANKCLRGKIIPPVSASVSKVHGINIGLKFSAIYSSTGLYM